MLTQQNPEMARVSPDPLLILVGVVSGHETRINCTPTNRGKCMGSIYSHMIIRVIAMLYNWPGRPGLCALLDGILKMRVKPQATDQSLLKYITYKGYFKLSVHAHK